MLSFISCLGYCGGLNRYGPHRLICLNAWPIGSGAVRRCDLVGKAMALMMEVCHCGGRPGSLICSKPCPVWDTVPFLLPVDQDIELSAPSPTLCCLPACCHASCHDDN